MDRIERGLYVHVPFCKRKCPYCDFFSVFGSPDKIDRFCNSLVNQINNHPEKISLTSIYFGGGTPSLLSGPCFERIVGAIRNRFDIVYDPEITIEVNPDDVSGMDLDLLKDLGINRVSLGLQSCDDEELVMLGRRHDSNTALKAYEKIRNYFDNVSVDIMFCLPGQDIRKVEKTLQKVISMDPCHISAYILKIYENTPFFGSYTEIDDDLSSDMYLNLCSILEENGYYHYEISSFCKQNRYSRHNLLYWSGGEYIGLGPGAHGYENGIRYMNKQNVCEYIYRKGIVDPIVLERIDQKEKNKEKIIFGLRTSFGVPLDAFDKNKNSFIEKIVREGLCRISDDKMILTDKGMILSNSIISELI